MRALVTCAMVVDLESAEIPEFAARMERAALDSMHAAMNAMAAEQRPLDEDEVEEFQERFQFYGVSYSVQQAVEPPVA